MTSNETTNNTNSTDYDYEDEVLIPSASVQFWTYLVFQIPSLSCTIYLLYFLIFNRKLRGEIHNHVVLILLIICFIILVVDNSLYLDGWRVANGNSFPLSPGICLLWWFIDYGFYGAISIFLVWASFERHILIFHRRQVFNTKRKIFFIHYVPIIFLSLYLIGFYTGAIIFPPCKNIFYYNYLSCGSYPCYQDVTWLNAWDYILNGVLCNILEALFSVSLLVRIIWRKYYSTRIFRWKKYRKMTIQLLSISALSLSINFPQSLIILVRQIGSNMENFAANVEPYFFYFSGYIILFIPFVSLASLPEVWPKIFVTRLQRRRIGPATVESGGRSLHMTVTNYA